MRVDLRRTRTRVRGPSSLLFLLILLMQSLPVYALPSFARQTGEECSACHVGAIGPQLTPHGQKFKIEGYSEGKAPSWYLPLSVQAIGSYTNTVKGQDGGASEHFSPNNNTAFQEASVFVAGKLAPGLGAFAQVTYSGVDQAVSWDNLDVRYAHTLSVLSRDDTVLGLSLNNSPTTQDPGNTLPAWHFPYVSSDLTPGYLGEPLLAGGLGQETLGLTAYTYWNDWVYLEGGAYRGLPSSFLKSVGVHREDQIVIDGPSPYWRLKVGHGFNRQYASIGLVGLNANIRPDPNSTLTDKYHDVGVDASYLFLGTRRHVFSFNARYIREHNSLYATAAGDGADQLSHGGSEYNVNGSYYYHNTYGFTIDRFGTSGTADATLYGSDPIGGTVNGSPNTRGTIFQLDYTPFGKETSWLAPWANIRLGLQYTVYDKFNGGTRDYDGAGRKASDNDTLFAFIWLAI